MKTLKSLSTAKYVAILWQLFEQDRSVRLYSKKDLFTMHYIQWDDLLSKILIVNLLRLQYL